MKKGNKEKDHKSKRETEDDKGDEKFEAGSEDEDDKGDDKFGAGSKDEEEDEVHEAINSKLDALIAESSKDLSLPDVYNALVSDGLYKGQILSCLDISFQHIGPDGAEKLASALSENSSLRILNAAYNNLGPRGIFHLSKALQKHEGLQEFCIYGNAIESAGGEFIADLLRKNSSILCLDLGYNELSSSGVSKLAATLSEHNFTLEDLRLHKNDLGDSGAFFLAEPLKSEACSLTSLDLSHNEISSAGAKEICKALMSNVKLKSLHLALGNPSIGPQGAASLAKLMKKNRYLEQVSCDFQSIGVVGIEKLGLVLGEKGGNFHKLHFYGNEKKMDGLTVGSTPHFCVTPSYMNRIGEKKKSKKSL
eukprot:g2642.t1